VCFFGGNIAAKIQNSLKSCKREPNIYVFLHPSAKNKKSSGTRRFQNPFYHKKQKLF